MSVKKTIFLLFVLGITLVLGLAVPCRAQSNDVAISVGGIFSPNSVSRSGSGNLPCPSNTLANCPPSLTCVDCVAPNVASSGVAFEGTLAHRVLNLDLVSLHIELPVMAAPNRLGNGVGNFSSVFVTPALKVRFSFPVASPFLSAGAGFAHFASHNSFAGNGDTEGAFQVGGGVDLKTPIPLLGFRAELREFRTGTYAATQHNIFAGGGIVLKF